LTKGRRSLANDNISILVGYANKKENERRREREKVDEHLYLLVDLKDSLANINCLLKAKKKKKKQTEKSKRR
jgi:hypothetical protein